MKKKKVIIFGDKDLAQLAKFYLEQGDSYYQVSGFTVHEKFLNNDIFEGLPVLPFENLEEEFNPKEYSLFAPITGTQANKLRQSIYNEGRGKGYSFISYVSPKATLFNNPIGDNCFILEDNTIQPFVKIGNNVVMWSGNHIGHHSIIHDHVFFTSHVVLSGHCIVENNSWFGVNSTIRDNIKIAEGTMVAMSASIIKDTESWRVYMGMPAKKIDDKFSYEVLK